MLHHSDELPEDHDELIRLAQDVALPTASVYPDEPEPLPAQRGVAIGDDAASLVEGPLVGFSMHGR
jgi:hypothetical protein